MISSPFWTQHTLTHTHTQSLVSILRHFLRKQGEVREEELAQIPAIQASQQEVRRCQGLLEEQDSELNDLIHVTRRGYTFHEAGVPPPPPQNQVSVFLIILQSCAYNVPKACKYQ